jgi:hypothetical protein
LLRLFCEYLCRMKKALKHVFSFSSSGRNTVLTIDNMLFKLLWSLSFVSSWHKATQLSYSTTQARGLKIVDNDDISIYTLEKLERLETL